MSRPYTTEALGRRLKGIVDTIAGAAIISVEIVVVEGQIEFITRPKVCNVEPRNRRDEFVRLLAFGTKAERDST